MAILAPKPDSHFSFMSLEEDIQQKEFRSEYHKAVLNIFHTHCYLVDKTNDALKKYDMTRQQYNVLRILRGQLPGHASVNLIKERMVEKMSDTSRIVERLRVKELVTRVYSENDKRRVDVTITQKGLDLLTLMQPDMIHIESFLHTLSESETRTLNELLDRVRASAQSLAGRDTPDKKITTLASL